MTVAIRTVAFTCAILLSAAFGQAQTGPNAPAKPQAAAPAAAPRVDRIETIEKGIYEAATGTMVADPNSAFGQRRVGGQATKFAQHTDTIPAEKGLTFGFRYKIVGEPKDATVTIKRVVIYPPGGIYNPKTGKTVFKESADVQRQIGSTAHANMRFGDNGRVPGTWTFQLWCDDRMLDEETFNVVSP